MKCCKYTASDLRAKITIESKSQASDGMGGWTETWATGDVVYAKWAPMRGGERWQAMRVGSSVSVKAVIRFRGDANGAPYYSAEDRVTYQGRTYAIKYVMDVDGAGEWLELLLEEGQPS